MLSFDNELNEYILEHSTDEDKVLKELNRETNLRILHPRMLAGHLQGRILEMISKMIHPENILEIGTFTGYSAICMAKGLNNNGKVHTIERNDELTAFAEKYIKKAGLDKKIILHTGEAREIIPRLDCIFDLAYIDADKNEYTDVYKLIFDKVREGGFILADNVIWEGKVVKKEKSIDKETSGIIEFNRYVQNDRNVENVILPVRDGLMIIRKTGRK